MTNIIYFMQYNLRFIIFFTCFKRAFFYLIKEEQSFALIENSFSTHSFRERY